MRIALYIEDGLDQIVLTPQTEAEKQILARLSEGGRDLTICRGEFYANRAGFVRQRAPDMFFDGPRGGDESTIIVLRQKKAEALSEGQIQNVVSLG